MADEPRSRYSDDRIHQEFCGIKSDITAKHLQNRGDIEALKTGHQVLTGKLDEGFGRVDRKQDKSLLLLKQVVGDDGEPGKGRLGLAEAAIENLKKFRWQAIAIISAAIVVLKYLKVL